MQNPDFVQCSVHSWALCLKSPSSLKPQANRARSSGNRKDVAWQHEAGFPLELRVPSKFQGSAGAMQSYLQMKMHMAPFIMSMYMIN